MQTKRPEITEIRRTGLSKINVLVRAAAQLDVLRPAFADWQAGEIYVCSKKGDYRYRFGARSKQTAPWSATVEKLFSTPAAFAFAAVVLGPSADDARERAVAERAAVQPPPVVAQAVAVEPVTSSRVDVISLAMGGAR